MTNDKTHGLPNSYRESPLTVRNTRLRQAVDLRLRVFILYPIMFYQIHSVVPELQI